METILFLVLSVLLVLLNGFFVATEFAIVKIRPTRIEELIRAKRPGAKTVRTLVRNLDGYLSATQLGITFASIALGWVGEPAFAHLIEGPLRAIGLVDPAWIDRTAYALAFCAVCVLHIVAGELAPKSLALLQAEKVALAAALPMQAFYFTFYPFIWTLNGVANLLLRVIGLGPAGHGGHAGHSEEEIRIILTQARSAGLLSAQRGELLQQALSLPGKTARQIMSPRAEVVFLDINETLEDNIARARDCRHTVFPLCDRELDDVIGFVDIREVLYAQRDGKTAELRSFAAAPVFLPASMSGERLLAEFRTRRMPMAIIVDEYGGASGIVTAADVVAVVVGALEHEDEAEMIALPGGIYDVDGATTLADVEETLHVRLRADDMRTVAGYMIARLGRIPRVGDRVTERGFQFNVLELDGPRVSKVRIQREVRAPSPKQ